MIEKRINLSFYFLLASYSLLLVYVANNFSLSPKEIEIFYSNKHDLLWYLTHISTHFLGTNNIGIRLPFIIFYILSVVLAYLLTDDYFKFQSDRLISISIFMVLPGLTSAAILVDSSIIVVFCILLYLYLYKLYGKEYYLLLFLFLIIDNSFAILYLSLFFYSLKKRDNVLLVLSLILFAISMYMYGFSIQGHPKGYFLDTFAIYASIFSPVLFFYFFYTIYRVTIKEEKDLYWYIAITSLLLSFVFSLRQKINISDFAPFVVIAVPVMVKLFLHSYRIRLRDFRTKHILFARIMILTLLLNTFLLIFNNVIYIFIDNPKKHFAYKYHGTQELAYKLKNMGIDKIKCQNKKLQKQLDFYGVTKGSKYYLSQSKEDNYFKVIYIKYFDKKIKTYYILLQK
jgi:hypothetical protein